MIKKAIFFLFLFGVAGLFANAKDSFLKGVEYYNNKNYQEALKEFLAVKNSGAVNAELYDNIGNTYFRMGQIGYAVLYYEKALKIAPNFLSAQKNLEFAKLLTRDKQEDDKTSWMHTFFRKLYNMVGANTAAAITLLLLALVIGLINYLNIFARHKDRTVFLFFIVAGSFLFIGSLIFSIAKYNDTVQTDKGVLIAPTEAGFSGPGGSYTRVFTIHEGMVFKIEKTENDWMRIKLENGLIGYIPLSSVAEVTLD